MRILFIHPNFPGQFLHLATVLGRDKQNQVVFLTKRKDREIKGVTKIYFKEPVYGGQHTHEYVRPVEKAMLEGMAAYEAAAALKRSGFEPDVVYGHSGWGQTLFMKDLFPRAAFVGYFEWYTNSRGACLDFDPKDRLDLDTAFAARISNVPILTDLCSCDTGISPTYWQQQQFPKEYQEKLQVVHDGIDVDYFQSNTAVDRILPEIGLDLREATEIVTYVGRGMEPYRGFPQFMEAVALLQQRRPNCHVVIVGADRMAYGGRKAPDGKTYKEWMLEKLQLDQSRIHFTGLLPYYQYRKILQISSVHVYLTVPFVLSWSMLEAMATGCLLVASNTPPVQEVILDGQNGFLTDFFDSVQIARKVEEALSRRNELQFVREHARETIVKKYNLDQQLKRQLQLLRFVCK